MSKQLLPSILAIICISTTSGCADFEENDLESEKQMQFEVVDEVLEINSRSLTLEELEAIKSSPIFIEVTEILAGQREVVELTSGEFFYTSDNSHAEAIFSIYRENDQADVGEFSRLTLDFKNGEFVNASLEPNEDFIPLSELAAPPQPTALGTCGSWSSWSTISEFCEWKLVCFGQATMLHRQRSRTCHFNNSSWKEYQNTTVRNKCGC